MKTIGINKIDLPLPYIFIAVIVATKHITRTLNCVAGISPPQTSSPRRLRDFWVGGDFGEMRTLNSSTDLFDPRTVMESDFSSGVSAADADFAFAFNDSNFSDRMLRIEILGDPPENMPDSEACISIADWARHRKRRREDIKKENGKILWFLFLWFCLVADKIWEIRGKLRF